MNERKKGRVSFIVPCFNHREYVVECLESIQKCGVDDYEVLVADDGSVDGSFEVIVRWIASLPEGLKGRFEVFQQSNLGVCKTLNKLLAMSTGEFIKPIASDDRLIPDSLSTLIDLLEKAPDLLAIFGDCRIIETSGRVIASSSLVEQFGCNKKLYLKRDQLALQMVVNWGVAGPSLLLRSEVIEKIGFFDETLVVEDQDYYLRLAALDAIIFVDITVADYRVHAKNTSSKVSVSRRLEILKGRLASVEKFGRQAPLLTSLFCRSECHLLRSKIFFVEGKMIFSVLQFFEFVSFRAIAQVGLMVR